MIHKEGPDLYLFSLLPDQSSFDKIIQNKAKVYDKWMKHMIESFEASLTEKGKEPD